MSKARGPQSFMPEPGELAKQELLYALAQVSQILWFLEFLRNLDFPAPCN